MKYIKKFNSQAEYLAYMNGSPAYPNVSYIREVDEVMYTKSPPVSTIVIDQTLTDPSEIISGDVNGEAIQMIRNNSHRYLGKTTASGEVTLCQLDDSNSTLYADGTAADLSGAEGDVFMRLPKFSYRAKELDADKWQVEFCCAGAINDSWQEWDGLDLIGVYEASLDADYKLCSRSGVISEGTVSHTNAKTYVARKGEGFSLVKWKHHSIIALLFYAMYGSTDCKTILGVGASTQTNAAGDTDSLGMTDTANGVTGSIGFVNFWGLENWWGGKGQWIDNVTIKAHVMTITEDDGETRELALPADAATLANPYASKLILGQFLDVAAKEVAATSKTGFCEVITSSSSQTAAIRGTFNEAAGGVVTLFAKSASYTYRNIGSRIAFRGNLIEENDVSTFKSLTTV